MIFLNNFVESLIVIIFLTFYLGRNSNYRHVYLVLFTLISAFALTYFEKFMPLEVFTTISLIIIEYIYCLLFTRRTAIEKVIACIYVELLIAIIVHIMILIIFNNNFNEVLQMNYDAQRLFIIFSSKIMLVVILYFTIRKREEYLEDIENRYLTSVVIELVVVFVISLFLSQIVFNFDVDYNLFLVVYVLLLVLSVFFVINYVNQLIYYKDLDNAKEEVVILEERVNAFNEIKLLNMTINSIRHDIKHQYALMKDYIKKGKYENIVSLINKEIKDLNDLPRIHISDNYVIDYLINKSLARARNSDLEFRYQVNIYNDVKIAETELNAVLSNAFDNAFENCSEKGSIKVNISENAGYAEFRITNTTDFDVLKNNPDLTSTKQGLHGFGINNMRRIVGSDGEVIIESSDTAFTVVIYIKTE